MLIPPPPTLSATLAPPLAEFLRWIADTPSAFQIEPEGFPDGRVLVRAVVCDIHETLFKNRPDDAFLQAFAPNGTGKVERNRLRWVLAACWVFWHSFFQNQAVDPERFRKLLVLDLSDLAAVAPVENLISDQDRREELARLVISTTAVPFSGETWEEFKDRLTQVDSIEAQRVIAQATLKEKKAREDRARREKQVRDEMARKAAEEAAAKTSRE